MNKKKMEKICNKCYYELVKSGKIQSNENCPGESSNLRQFMYLQEKCNYCKKFDDKTY